MKCINCMMNESNKINKQKYVKMENKIYSRKCTRNML